MNPKKNIIESEDLPKWSSPIRHAVVVNNRCFVSGQLALNSKGEYISGSTLI